MKHLYKLIALLFLFILSIFYFGKTIPEISAVSLTATSMQDSTFPLIYLQVDDYTINTLHGYSSELDSGLFRESITPLDADKTFQVKIQQNESKIRELSYELKDIVNKRIIESDTLSAFDSAKGYLTANIKINAGMDTSTEYGMQITLTTNYSKKISFYTRIKYYTNDFFLQQKLDFVKNFHDASFGKKKDFNISTYLEANTNPDTTFADVDIHSSSSMITWKKRHPKKLTDVIPTIHEINIETASISQVYFAELETDTGLETYRIQEYYRVRYAGNRIYLLAFHRTMEALFNPDFVSLKKSEFKIGISNETDMEILSSLSNKKVAFVRNGSLWYYDLESNKLTSVFSFEHNSKDYIRDYYMEHDIKILKITDDGDISFMLYGYMNCGDYEGRTGVLLYDYNSKENQITERVYLPLKTTFQQLKEDLGSYSYVNNKDIFYFSLNNKVYAYNMTSRKYEILTNAAARDHFSMLKDAKCFVWSNMGDNGQAKNITILDLDTSKRLEVESPDDESIIVLGTIDANIVYGFVRNKDIYESNTGEITTPAYKLLISDCNGKILREYQIKNRYVTNATVHENIIRLKRVQKKNGRFIEASSDTIMNQKSTEVKSVRLTTRITQNYLTEKYLSLPAGFILEKKPTLASTNGVLITENTTLHFPESETNSAVKYYIYADGGITQSQTSVSKAIREADAQMGTVMDNHSHIVWERGGKFLSKQLSNISYPEDNSSSLKACTQMLLEAAQVTITTTDLKKSSILSNLKEYLDRPVNLTGCTLDEILYFVSGGKPVIALTDANHAVLITAYSSVDVTWMDPSTRRSRKMSLASAEKYFKNAGYRFISYIN